MGRMSRGWEMTKLSFAVIKQNRTLLLFPVISGISMMMILSIILAGFWFVPELAEAPQWFFIILGFFIYVILFFISYYFQAGLVACAYATMEGEAPSMGYGMKKANTVIGRLFTWAIISAVLGMILQAIESRFPIASRLIGAAWGIATYFVVPIIVFEDTGAWPSMKRSWQVLKGSWGEALTGHLATTLIFFLLALLFIPLVILAAMMPNLPLMILFAIIALGYLIFIILLASAVSTVLRTALYRYTTTGKMNIRLPDWFPPPMTTVGQVGSPGNVPQHDPYAPPRYK